MAAVGQERPYGHESEPILCVCRNGVADATL